MAQFSIFKNVRLRFTLATIVFAVFGLAPAALAAPDIRAPFLQKTGSLTPGSTITFSGDVQNAITATPMNLTNSYGLERISRLNLGSTRNFYVQDIVLSGDYVFAAHGASGFDAINISNPLAPYLASSIDPLPSNDQPRPPFTSNGSDTSDQIELYGNYVFTAGKGYADTIKSIAISSPDSLSASSVKWSSSLSALMSTSQESIVIYGNYMYVGTQSAGNGLNLLVYDISNPESASYIRGISTGPQYTNVISMTTSGSYLYVLIYTTDPVTFAYSASKLLVYSLADPSSPQPVSSATRDVLLASLKKNSITADGSYLYFSRACSPSPCNRVFDVYDISTPNNPIYIYPLAPTGKLARLEI
ncbi:MAG: hypothetical protein Q7S52_02245 [bacterium]|nr:hypothetical protein [bacterium]